jgi:hypothetical protein
MSEWRENAKGNFVYVIDTDDIMVVFQRPDGDWAGVYQDRFTKGAFDTAAEAMEAMEPILNGDTEMLHQPNPGWVANKKGSGFHIRIGGGIASVKLAQSGSWYATVDGVILKGQWFPSASKAKQAVSEYIRRPTSHISSAHFAEFDWHSDEG